MTVTLTGGGLPRALSAALLDAIRVPGRAGMAARGNDRRILFRRAAGNYRAAVVMGPRGD